MPSPLYSGAAAYNLGVLSRNETLGWDFFQGLKDNGITVDKGNGAIQKAVVAGEKSCGILVDYMANRSKNDGAPVEFVYPEEGSPAITEPIGVLKDSRNQEAAEAFVDFVLSDEGQELAASIGYTPVKEGVAAPEGLNPLIRSRPSVLIQKNFTAAVTQIKRNFLRSSSNSRYTGRKGQHCYET